MRWPTLTVAVLLLGATPLAGPDYVTLDDAATELRTAFNAANGKVRIIAYVAPTCGGCLRGVDQLQKRVLPETPSRDLQMYVVWVKKNGAQEKHMDRVTGLLTDSRGTHYWDEHRAMVPTLDTLLGIPGRACAGAFLVYGPDQRWEEDAPPSPKYWSDAHAAQFEDHGPAFEAERLTEEIRQALRQ